MNTINFSIADKHRKLSRRVRSPLRVTRRGGVLHAKPVAVAAVL